MGRPRSGWTSRTHACRPSQVLFTIRCRIVVLTGRDGNGETREIRHAGRSAGEDRSQEGGGQGEDAGKAGRKEEGRQASEDAGHEGRRQGDRAREEAEEAEEGRA